MSYTPNSTEKLYIDKFIELLKPYGLDYLLKSTVESIKYHAYQKGFEDGRNG